MKIDILNTIKLQASLTKEFHIQPSEMNNMPMWEFEIFVKQLNTLVEEQNDKQKKEMDQYHVKDYMNMTRPGNLQKMTQGPDFSKMNTPNFGRSMPSPGGLKGFGR